MKSGVTITKNTMTASLQRIQKRLETLPKLAYNEFVKVTPVRSGNAKRKTRLQGKDIVANYPYARRLDEGYSNQAPQGMSKPTEDFVKRETDKMMRK